MSGQAQRTVNGLTVREVSVAEAAEKIDNKGPKGVYLTREHMMYTAVYCDGNGLVEVVACRTEAERDKWVRGKR